MIHQAAKICFLLLLLTTHVGGQTVRPPAVAGSFYPADSATLAEMVRSHLDNVTDLPEINGRIIALIVPHAGLVYSGQIAAYAYKLLENSNINKVILCGPSHRYRFMGMATYGPGVQWKTPLGMVACDDDLCSQMLKYDASLQVIKEAHASEHSLEVQLPYLQTVLGDFRIAPVAMGLTQPKTTDMMAHILETLDIDERTILVASTDWQHYRPASEGWVLDSIGMACLEDMDPQRLRWSLTTDKTEACGGAPAEAVLKAAIGRGANRVKILKYGDSGDLTGDKSSVVGYVAAVIYREDETAPPDTSRRDLDSSDYHLSADDRQTLLRVARQSIEQYLVTNSMPEFEVSDKLQAPGAAFVTLEKDGRLRGCIGHTVAVEPLYRTVSVCAVQAALADRRFKPVTTEELAGLHIEISVLTPLQTVESPDEIEVGRDGLMISRGDRRGLLLPQVASEYGWTREEFLEATCRKAGLPAGAWKTPSARIEKFQAVVFGE